MNYNNKNEYGLRKCKAKYMTDYLRIMNVNIKNMKHIYFTHYRFYITQKLYICTINNILD